MRRIVIIIENGSIWNGSWIDFTFNDKCTRNCDTLFDRLLLVPELGPVYLLKVTEPFMGISGKGIPWDIRNSTAGAPQPGHVARIDTVSPLRQNRKYRNLWGGAKFIRTIHNNDTTSYVPGTSRNPYDSILATLCIDGHFEFMSLSLSMAPDFRVTTVLQRS